MRPRLLLTGFGPFGSLSVNPTEQLMHAIAGAGPATQAFPDADVETVILDTDYSRVEPQFRAAVERFDPHAILSFGVSGGTDELCLERIAVNLDDAGISDSGGHARVGTRIVEDGPVGYWATLPLDPLFAALREAGLPVRMSNHAGTYLCNHLLYYGLHWIQTRGLKTTMGFVHVPPLPALVREGGRAKVGMDLQTLVDAARVCVDALRSV